MNNDLESLKQRIRELEAENYDLKNSLRETRYKEVNIDSIYKFSDDELLAFTKLRLEREQSLADIGDWYFDYSLRTLYLSDQIKKMMDLELDLNLPIGEQLSGLFHKDDIPIFLDLNHKLRMQGLPYRTTIRRVFENGKIKYFYAWGEPVYENGKLTKIWGAVQDISSLKQVEQNLISNEKKFRRYFELPLVGFSISDRSGKWINVNQKLCDILGYTKEELLEMNWMQLTPESDLEAEYAIFSRIGKEIDKNQVFNFEKRYIRKDGSIIDVNISSICVPDHEDNIEYFIAVYNDISEQKKLKAVLDENIEKYKIVADFTYDWEYWKNIDLEYIYCSPSCKRITGYDVEEFKQDKELWRKFIHPDSLPTYLHHLTLSRDEVQTVEFKIITKEGEEKWILHVCNPVYNSKGEYIGVRGSNKDISELKKLTAQAIEREQQLLQTEKMASLGVLMAGVAHEINNPNNLIMFNNDILKKLISELITIIDDYYCNNPNLEISGVPYSSLRDEILMLSNGIAAGAERIRDIIKDLKHFTGFENIGDYKEIDVNSIVKAACVIANSTISEVTDNFSLELASHLPQIRGNFSQLEQVVINLIINSCQALSNKSQSVNLSTSYDEINAHVIIEINDEGVGISESIIDKIFDPFFTTKRDNGGMGLGLAICYRIIEKHGGKLLIESQENKGCKAKIILPVSNKLNLEIK